MAQTKEKKNINNISKLTRLVSIIVVICNLIMAPFYSEAATLGVQSLVAKVAPGKTFTVRVSVNTQGKAINNAEGIIRYPTNLVQAVSVSSGGVFSLWVEPPAISSPGTISFNGGVPNPGFTGSGQIMTATFKALKAGTATSTLSGAAVRANDGLGTNIISGQSNGSIVITGEETPTPDPKPVEPPKDDTLSAVTITSLTHPDSNAWYNASQATFSWRLPAGASATQSSFDQNPNSTPSVTRRPGVSSISIDSLQTGVWYFHLRYLVNQTWSRTASYKIQVDTLPPENLQLTTRVESDGSVKAIMSATDTPSGIANYKLQIDAEPPIIIPAADGEISSPLPILSDGVHSLSMTVFDRAGNSALKNIEYKNETGERVIITKYDKEIEDNQRIEVFGLTTSNSSVRISLASEDGLTRYYFVTSTGNGEFSFISEPIASGGTYTLWAELESKEGKISASSEKVQIIVKQSLLSQIRDFFTSLKSLSTVGNVLALLFLILAIIGWAKYIRLRKKIMNSREGKSVLKTKAEHSKR